MIITQSYAFTVSGGSTFQSINWAGMASANIGIDPGIEVSDSAVPPKIWITNKVVNSNGTGSASIQLGSVFNGSVNLIIYDR